MQESSAGVLLFRRPLKFLLLAHAKGHWDFPKGNIEPGESEEQTALRELKEETGILHARLIPGFRERIEYFYRFQGRTVHKTVVFFLAESPLGEVKLSHEHTGFEWLSPKEAGKKLFPNSLIVLAKALDFLARAGNK